jgi:hypothetical protein
MSKNSVIVLISHFHRRLDLIFSLTKGSVTYDGYCKSNEIYCRSDLTLRQGPTTGKLLTLTGNPTPTVGLQFKKIQIFLNGNAIPVFN